MLQNHPLWNLQWTLRAGNKAAHSLGKWSAEHYFQASCLVLFFFFPSLLPSPFPTPVLSIHEVFSSFSFLVIVFDLYLHLLLFCIHVFPFNLSLCSLFGFYAILSLMSDLYEAMDIITRKMEEMLWETLPARLSLDMDYASHMTSTVMIGKIIGLKPPDKSIIINTILVLWKFALDLKIEAMENSTYHFHFSSPVDKDKVLLMAYLNFKGHLLVLQHWSPTMTIDEVDPTQSSFWIQLYGLPMARMNHNTISTVGSSVGYLLEIEKLRDGVNFKHFFHIKVSFNVYLLLKDGFPLPRPNLPDTFINFCYEKLSDFYYKCGCIGHS